MADLESIKEKLHTPVVGDILDQMGLYHQFLPARIRPMQPAMKVAGYAMPVLMMDVYGPQEAPFGLLTQALDALRPHDVYVASGAMHRSANWGELLTATAVVRGAAGAVVDGYHRDTPQVLEQGFPVFSIGSFAQDSGPRMKVADFRADIELGGVPVRNGDLIFGDCDGVLCVPSEIVDEVIGLSLEKASAEKAVRSAIEGGMSATDAYEKYRVL